MVPNDVVYKLRVPSYSFGLSTLQSMKSRTSSVRRHVYGVTKITTLCMICRRRTLTAPCPNPSDGFPAWSDLRRTCSAAPLLWRWSKGLIFAAFLYIPKLWSDAPDRHGQNSPSQWTLGQSTCRGHPRDQACWFSYPLLGCSRRGARSPERDTLMRDSLYFIA